jgi:spermidine/putrescine transport system permease protein
MTRLRLLLAPALAAILIFMALPIALTTLCSVLTPWHYGGVNWEPSAEAYVRLLFERDIFDEALTFNANYLQFLARSVLQAGIATVPCLIVGLPTAWFIATRSAGQKPLWLMLVTVPCWVNLPVRTIALLLILRDEGPANNALQSIGLTDGPLPLACNNLAIGLGLVSSFLPFMILPLYAAIERFDFPLLEAAYDLNANCRKVFFAVVLPILRPGLIARGASRLHPGHRVIPCARHPGRRQDADAGEPDRAAVPGQPQLAVRCGAVHDPDGGDADRPLRNRPSCQPGGGVMAQLDTRHRDIRNLPGFGLTALLAVAFLYAPILFLMHYSVNDARSISRLDGLSLRWYRAVFANEEIGGAALNSLLLAVIAASIATVMARAAALTMVRMRVRRKAGAYAILNFPLMVPEIVTAIATLIVFSAIGLGPGIPALVIAHTTFCIPFAYLPTAARLSAMDPGLEAAAADLYARPWRRFRLITLPLLSSGVVSGWLLAFIVSLDDFIISSMLSGPGSTTLPVHIYSMLRLGITPEVNAVSTLMVAASTLFVIASGLIGRSTR